MHAAETLPSRQQKPGVPSHGKAKENKAQGVVLLGCLDNQTDGLTAPCLRNCLMFKLTIGHKPTTGTLKRLEGCVTIGTLAKHNDNRRLRGVMRERPCQALRRCKVFTKKQVFFISSIVV